MKKLVPFTFETSKVRVLSHDGEPWFVATDVCRALGHSNSRMAVQSLDDDEKGVSSTYTPGGQQDVTLINESGLYTLILRCRDATTPGTVSHRFRKWVTAEVLPSIRKTGRYDTGNERRDASVGFQMMCETLQGSRKASGKDTKPHHSINEARMINAALTGAFQGISRATLNRAEFDLLIRLEHENEFLDSPGKALCRAQDVLDRLRQQLPATRGAENRQEIRRSSRLPNLERRTICPVPGTTSTTPGRSPIRSPRGPLPRCNSSSVRAVSMTRPRGGPGATPRAGPVAPSIWSASLPSWKGRSRGARSSR